MKKAKLKAVPETSEEVVEKMVTSQKKVVTHMNKLIDYFQDNKASEYDVCCTLASLFQVTWENSKTPDLFVDVAKRLHQRVVEGK